MTAVVGFGPEIEDSLLPLVENSGAGKDTRLNVRQFAILALGKVGKERSLAALQKNQDFFVKNESAAAIAQLRARLAK
jgi:HEAT repeat protein